MTEYIRDGHRLYLRFGVSGEVDADLKCPVAGTDYSRLPFEQQPPCHQIVAEDVIDEVETPDTDSGKYCNVKKWFENGVLGDYLHTDGTFNITRVPVPIEWAFVDEDLHIRPYDPTANLPTWDQMTDLDKGALIMFAHKVEYEGYEYAAENYPVNYLEDPRLTALDQDAANDHAYEFIQESKGPSLWLIPSDEKERLYDLADAEATRRFEEKWQKSNG